MSKKIREKSVAQTLEGLQPGDLAPGFSVTLDDGRTVTNQDFAGQRLVIFFYPKAGTEGCTREAADFNRLAADFKAANSALLGVSADSSTALQRFRAKHDLTIPLASDEEHHMLAAFGVWAEKKMYGRSFMGILRTTFLLEPDNRIGHIWRNVKVRDHAETVLASLKS